MRGDVGKVNKSGQAHHCTTSPKADDNYCSFARPYTAFPHRGDAPSLRILDSKVRHFACNRLSFVPALEVCFLYCGLLTYADQ
jgi:hypothetical protein